MYSQMTIGGCIVLMQSARMQTSDKKEQVLKCFTEVDGRLHLVIATAASGMDIDCSDIWRVLHWGITKHLGGVYPGKWSSRTRWRALCGSAL